MLLHRVTLDADPANPLGAATKQYVDGRPPFIPRSVAASTTAAVGEFIRANATTGTLTITSPASPALGAQFAAVKEDASSNAVVITGTVNGDPEGAQLVGRWSAATFTWVGSGWIVDSTNEDGGTSLGADLIVVAAGTTDNRAAIASADAIVAGAGGAVVLRGGVHRVASNLTVASPVILRRGATIKPDSGVTVTLAGGVDAPRAQVFDHSAGGLVVPGRVDYYHPAWWGPVGTSDDTAAWTAMAAALDASKITNNGVLFGQRILAPVGANQFFGITLSNCHLVADRGSSVFFPSGDPTSGSMLTLNGYCQVSGGYWRTNGSGQAITLLDSRGFRDGIDSVYVVPGAAGSTGISLGFGGTGTSTTPVLRDVRVHSGAPADAPVGIGIYLNSPDSEFINIWVARCHVGIQYDRGNATHTNVHVWGCNTGLAGSPDELKLVNLYAETNRGWGVDFSAADRNMITNGHVWANGAGIAGTGGMRLLKPGGVSSKDNIITSVVFDDNTGTGLLIDGAIGTEVQGARFASRIVQGGGSPLCNTGVRVTSTSTNTRLTIRGRRSEHITAVLDDQSTSTATDFGSYKRTLSADVTFVAATGLGTLFSLPVDVNERWLLEGLLVVDGPQAADIKVRVQATGATGSTGSFALVAAPAASTTSTTAASLAPATTAALAATGGPSVVAGLLGVGVAQGLPLSGWLLTSTTVGAVDVQAAQQNSDAGTVTVRAGSWFRATRIA